MKNYIIFSLMVTLIKINGLAQIGDLPSDMEDEGKPSPHYAGFDFGLGTLMLDNEAAYPYWKASDLNLTTFNFNLFEYKIPIIKHYLGLTTGLGAGANSIRLQQYDLVHAATVPGGKTDTIFGVTNSIQNYRSNTLSYFTVNVPLMIEVCSKAKAKKSFYLDIGAVGYWNIGGSWATSGKYLNGDRFSNTVNSRFQMAPFGAYATVRTGFDFIGIFANYNLTNLFKKDATGAVVPFTAGLTLNWDIMK